MVNKGKSPPAGSRQTAARLERTVNQLADIARDHQLALRLVSEKAGRDRVRIKALLNRGMILEYFPTLDPLPNPLPQRERGLESNPLLPTGRRVGDEGNSYLYSATPLKNICKSHVIQICVVALFRPTALRSGINRYFINFSSKFYASL